MRNEKLLKDPILKVLFTLAMPLMGISFIQMTYGLVDTLWLGRLSTESVAAVGAVSIFVWLAYSIILIARTGLSVGMSQAYGRGDQKEIRHVMAAGFQVNFVFCLFIGGLYFFGRSYILSFYGLSPAVAKLAEDYLAIIALGMVFTFFNPMLSSLFITKGNSITPFKVAGITLVINILLDPVLIFGLGFIAPLGIKGAAYATVFSQAIASFLYIFLLIKNKNEILETNFLSFRLSNIREILTLGLPACLQSMVHALVGIVLNRYIAGFGSNNIAVYSIGAQIESISWMSAEGYAVALSTFVGQNYGARQYKRVESSYIKSLFIMGSLGIFSTILLFFWGRDIFSLFLPKDPTTIMAGSFYLKIISLSQLFMIVEIVTSGAMNGLALTKYPAFVAVLFNLARIPLALLLMPMYGVLGIWWAMSLSGIAKGLGLLFFYSYLHKKTCGFTFNMQKYISRKEI